MTLLTWRIPHMQVLGGGRDKELFYTDYSVKQAYKNYVKTILERTNTYTGLTYKDSPVIFSGTPVFIFFPLSFSFA
jgi:hypothetical protein